MTRDEYRAKTEIKDDEEARALLTWWRFSLGLCMVNFAIAIASVFYDITGPAQMFLAVISLGAVSLFIYLAITIGYYVRVGAGSVAVMILIPLAWIWGYFKLAAPLQIIAGKKAPPEHLPQNLSNVVVNALSPYLAKTWFRVLLTILAIIVLIFISALRG